MPFSAECMIPGEVFDVASRFAMESEGVVELSATTADRADTERELWRRFGALGVSNILISEMDGGAGGELLDFAAVLEGIGRWAFPLPVLAACGIVPLLIDALGDDSTQLLGKIATGEVTVCPALAPLAPWRSRDREAPLFSRSGRDVRVEGDILGVDSVPGATHYVIAGEMANAESTEAMVVLVPTGSGGETVIPRRRIDGRSTFDLRLAGATVGADKVIARGQRAREAVAEALDLAAVLVCVETVAAMGHMIERTIEYLAEREQFGVKLASFQALRHDVADMFVAYSNLFALVNHSVRLASTERPLSPDVVALTKIRLGDVGRSTAQSAIQVHGGMGMTQELLATRLATRILMANFEYGDGNYQAERLVASRR
jgi:alkylation response protein AidB-like acyl-CoA dehydrogenase